jgi:hypothetical protein
MKVVSKSREQRIAEAKQFERIWIIYLLLLGLFLLAGIYHSFTCTGC